MKSPTARRSRFRAGAPANQIFAPHPNERSQAFLGPPLLTPRQAQLRCLPGPRYWRQRPIIAYRNALWQARGRFGGVVIWGSNLRDAQLKFHNNDVCARWLLYPQLLDANLIDRLLLLTVPIVLGKGKRIFGNTSHQVALKLMKCEATPTGVIMATYERAGVVPTGSL